MVHSRKSKKCILAQVYNYKMAGHTGKEIQVFIEIIAFTTLGSFKIVLYELDAKFLCN
jgi:hypothetical protein